MNYAMNRYYKPWIYTVKYPQARSGTIAPLNRQPTAVRGAWQSRGAWTGGYWDCGTKHRATLVIGMDIDFDWFRLSSLLFPKPFGT